MPIKTSLFDVKTFDLDAHYPRKPVVTRDTKPSLFSRQPFTALYLSVYVPVLLVLVPPYAVARWVYARATSSAPAARWSLLDFVTVYVVRHTLEQWWCRTQGGIRGFSHSVGQRLTDAQRQRRRRWFGAMPDYVPVWKVEQLQGAMLKWARETRVRDDDEIAVSVWWMGQRGETLEQARAKNGEKLLVYFTGGGYMVSTCHPIVPLSHVNHSVLGAFEAYAKQNSGQANAVPRSSITVEYRKSAAAPTPSAFIDCLAAYMHVVNTLGFKPENITLLGDSAGAHLVNTLIRYLLDAKLQVPDAAILIAPWTDQAGTIIEHPHSSYQRNAPYDVLSPHFYRTCTDTFAMHFRRPNETLLDVYYSPCAVLGKVRRNNETLATTAEAEASIFRGWPRTFIVGLTGDVLLDQATEMHRRASLAADADATSATGASTLCLLDGCHDPFIAPPFVFASQRRKALDAIPAWFLGGGSGGKGQQTKKSI